MKNRLFTILALIVIALLNGGTMIKDEDIPTIFIALAIFIIGGTLVYFIVKRIFTDTLGTAVVPPQENYEQSIKIRYGLPSIVIHGLVGAGFLYAGGAVVFHNGPTIFMLFPCIGIYLLHSCETLPLSF
ncbi:MAG: hypothetical protein HY762_01015 [Planctomycetes bacterium]|nr:hypothetical protein [Planctomycetota bacterium]